MEAPGGSGGTVPAGVGPAVGPVAGPGVGPGDVTIEDKGEKGMLQPEEVVYRKDFIKDRAKEKGKDTGKQAGVVVYDPRRMSARDPHRKRSNMTAMGFGPSACGRCLYMLIIFLATMSLLMTTIVHIFAWYQKDIEALSGLVPKKIDWFRVSRKDKWSEVGCIMEVMWTFWIWIAIFFLQLIWIFYGMVLMCRRTKEGFLYESAATMPCTIYLVFLIALGVTATWNVFWGESGQMLPEYAKWGAVVLGGAALLFHITLSIAVRAFIASIPDLRSLGKTYDLLWNQLFTHNGLAAIASWVTVVTMYAITSILDERNLIRRMPNFACAIGLSLIMLYMLVWFLFDMFFTKKSLYYVFSPYAVVAITFVSALIKNMATFKGEIYENMSLILCGVFLSVTALFFVIKAITVIVRGRYSSDEKDDVRSLHDDNVYVMQ